MSEKIDNKQIKRRIDVYKEEIRTTKRHAPISELIGMDFVHIEEGKAVFELELREDFLNSVHSTQGGVLAIMADAAMGIAFGSLLDIETHFSTIEFKINFFRPVRSGHLVAEGVVINKTKRTGYTECTIKNENGKMVARAVGTCIII